MILSLRELIFDGKDACSVFANYNNSRQTSLSIDANGKVHVCSCPTSAEKSGNFSAEVGEVLWSVFKTSFERLFFALCLIPADEKNDFVFNGLKNNSLKSCV